MAAFALDITQNLVDATTAVDLFMRTGPFFLSLFFLVVLTRWAYTQYNKACVRSNPRASAKELLTLQVVFVAFVVGGFVLSALSIYWWFVKSPTLYVFQGTIKDLNESERISSSDLFQQQVPHQALDPALPRSRDERFVVVRDRPFSQQDRFEIKFYKSVSEAVGKVDTLLVDYLPNDHKPQFRIEFDPAAGRNVLKRVSTPTGAGIGLETPVYAAEREPGQLPKSMAQAQTAPDQTGFALAVVQDERSSVGAKLKALDTLAAQPKDALRETLARQTGVELALLTLLDLTRHSDRELAYRAREVVDRADSVGMIVDAILRGGPNDPLGLAIAERLDNAQRHAVIARLPENQRPALAEPIRRAPPNALCPTASETGDRYYVRVSWPSTESPAFACLTRLFNAELASSRTLDEEAALMKGLTRRYVYWYSKPWALQIAASARKCGATAAFSTLRPASRS